MEAHVLRIVSRGKTPATGRLEHLPKLWLHAPVRFELACAAPEDTEAALDDTPTYSISIHSLDASRNPVDSPLVWYAEVDAEGNTDKSKGPHAVFELSAADIANVTEAGEYWLAFHAYSGGERIVRAAGYLTFTDDGFPTDPPDPTPPGTVYLTQAAGDARYVRDPGVVVDNRIVRWDGVSGNTVQSSLVTVGDDGNVSTPGSVSASSLQVAGTFQADMYVDDLSADRTHALPNADGTYALTGETDGKVNLIDLKDVAITTPSTGHVLTWNGTLWVNAAPSGGGGGGSVTVTGNDGIGVSGSPGTSITLSLGSITPDALTVAGATEFRGAVLFTSMVDPVYSVEVSAANIAEGGGQLYWPTTSGLTLAVVGNPDGVIRASDVDDGTTVGRNILKLANPGAITFLRMNADNTVTALSDSNMRTALGLGNVATRNVGTSAGTAAAGDDSRFHTAFSIAGALAPVFNLTGQSLGPSATLTADGLVFWDDNSGQFDVITLPGTTTTYLRGDGTFATTFDPASPGAIGGTTPSTAVFTSVDVRTELDIQSTSGAAGPILAWNTPTTEATHWERARLQWSSNVFIIGTQRNGSGVAREIEIQPGGTTAARFTTDGRMVVGGTSASTNTLLTINSPSSAMLANIVGAQCGIALRSGSGNIMLGETSIASGPLAGAFSALYQNDGAACEAADRLGGFLIGGATSPTSVRNAAIAEVYATELYTASASGSAWNFATTENGTNTRAGKLWINHNGNIGIGYNSGAAVFSVTAQPTARLQIRGSGTGATETLRVENSSGTARFTVRDDGAFAFAGGTVGVADTGWTTFTNLTTDKTCDANATTVEELADILGTLIVALKAKGIIAN